MTIPRRLVAAGLLGTLIAGCNGASEESDEEGGAAQVALVEAQPATVLPMQASVTVYGRAEVSADQAQSVTVDVESRVVAVLVAPGESVKRGQALLNLQPSAGTRLEADKAVRDASAMAAEVGRIGRLHEQGLATDAELAAARAAAESAIQMRDSLSERIAGGARVPAPRAGVVDELKVQPGDLLPAGTVVARVIDPAAVIARLGLDPESAARVRPQQRVVLFPLTAGARAVQGRVTQVDPRIDPQTRFATALVRIDSPAVLATGTSLRGEVVIDRHPKAITVPRSAVLFEKKQASVFVVSGGKAKHRDVMTGFDDSDRIEIVSGISVGEQVVATGNYELEDGMPVRVSQPKP